METLAVLAEELTVDDKFDMFGLKFRIDRILLGEYATTIYARVTDGSIQKVILTVRRTFPFEIYSQIDSDIELNYLIS